MQVNPYVSFDGRCEVAFQFYKKCLNCKIESLVKYGETPMANDVPPEWKEKIIHGTLSVDGKVVLMGADVPPDRYKQAHGLSIMIGIGDTAEARKVFDALSENASIHMPFQKTFWSEGFGMLVDQFGIPWMVNSEHSA